MIMYPARWVPDNFVVLKDTFTEAVLVYAVLLKVLVLVTVTAPMTGKASPVIVAKEEVCTFPAASFTYTYTFEAVPTVKLVSV
jgi:hypothetical protein